MGTPVIFKQLSLSRKGDQATFRASAGTTFLSPEGKRTRYLLKAPSTQVMTTFSSERQLACCRIPRRKGTLEVQRKTDGRKIVNKHCRGRGATTIHQRLDTVSEVYWKMFFPLSCSIKRKNKERKSCCNFLCHRTCSGKNRPDSLLHFPINGRSAPSQAPTSAHPAPERQKVKQARARSGRRPPHHPICHLPLLHLGG